MRNGAIAGGSYLYLQGNPLGQNALCGQIPALEARGAHVYYYNCVCGEDTITVPRTGPGIASVHEIDGGYIGLKPSHGNGRQAAGTLALPSFNLVLTHKCFA